jgi:HemY protein
VAIGAIEARDWTEARDALVPLIDDRLTPRVCTLMARIEAEQHGDAGRAREWFMRAATATRDPAWTADGVVSARWSPVSPVTGALDAMRWAVPVEVAGERSAAAALAARMEALVAPALPRETQVEAASPTPPAGPAGPAAPPEVRDAPQPVAPVPASPPAQALPPAQAAARTTAPAPSPAPATTAVPATPTAPSPRVEQLEEVAPDDPPVHERKAPVAPKKPPPRPAAATQARVRKPVEQPKIFVAPRAPDDPGTEALESDDFSPYPSKA